MQKLVTLIVPSFVLEEFRRLGSIYAARLLVTYPWATANGQEHQELALAA